MTEETMHYDLGCRMPIEQWLWLNRTGIFERSELRQYTSPFPPADLMHIVSGLQTERDFAKHGTDLFAAVSEASPIPLTEYAHILDFGCGCGRLARLFKGHPGTVHGCDLDRRHVEFIQRNFDFMEAKVSSVQGPLPYSSDQFDAVISISVFSHLNERSQDHFLRELYRVSRRGAYLFLSIHGERARARAEQEQEIWKMIRVHRNRFRAAGRFFARGKHAFILQHGHLTNLGPNKTGGRGWLRRILTRGSASLISERYEYGITFIPETYVRDHWARWFKIEDYRAGAIHDFQDIIVLQPRK